MTAASLADWISVGVAIVNVFVGVAIALALANVAKQNERIQNAQIIFSQWAKKKELSIQFPAIAKVDSALYTPNGTFELESQQQRVWLVLIIDVLFNSFVANKKGAYPSEIFDEDMRAHMGALIRYDKKLLLELMNERGYTGGGVVGEFAELVNKLIEELGSAKSTR